MKQQASKRVIGFGAVLLLTALSVWIYQTKRGHPEEPLAQSLPLSNQNALYSIEVKVVQGSVQPELVLDLVGELNHWQQQPGEYGSKWIQFSRLKILGQDTDQATQQSLLQIPIFSQLAPGEAKFIHYFDPKFPHALKSTHANILNKILVPFLTQASILSGATLSEKDELGPYKVSYTLGSQDKNITVDKKWLSYEGKPIKIDSSKDSMHYVLNQDWLLISAVGILNFKYDNNDEYTIEIEVRPSLTAFKSHGQQIYTAAKMQSFDADNTAKGDPSVDLTQLSAMDYLKVLERLDLLDAESSGTEAYALFSALKSDLLQHPDHSNSLFDKIRQTSSRDPGSQRRLQILFGALAQSQSSKIAEGLAELATKCQDDFCRIQALVATSDHPHPTDAVVENLLIVANSQQSTDAVGTALLSLGTVAEKLDSSALNISRELQKKLVDPSFVEVKSTVLAAMGNHGDASYYEALKLSSEAKDPSVRAAAIYSLRQLPQEAAGELLLRSITKEKDRNVLLEGFKALAYRDLSQEDYKSMALRAAAIPDQDIQQLMARTLIIAAKENPSKLAPAIEALLSNSTIAATKEYLAAEIEPAVRPSP